MKKKNGKNGKAALTGILEDKYDYQVYQMQMKDYLISISLGFAAAFIVLMAFFENSILAVIGGVATIFIVPKHYGEYCKKRRLQALREQFRDLLESLSASYSAGRNTPDAFHDAMFDMNGIYGEDSDIVMELQLICAGLENNITIEVLLGDFAKRSGIDDIKSFSDVFEICNRQGGDIRQVVNQTRDVIGDKMEVEMEIQTMIAGNKNELNIMMVMPVVIVVMLRGLTGSGSISLVMDVVVKLISLGIFLVAYVLGKKIVDIKL